MRASRSWIVAAYLLAGVLAQGWHDHGEEGPTASQVLAGCDDSRPGMAGHNTPDQSRLDDHCPACHLRAQAPLWRPTDLVCVRERVGFAPVPIPLCAPARPLRLLPSRAPPLV